MRHVERELRMYQQRVARVFATLGRELVEIDPDLGDFVIDAMNRLHQSLASESTAGPRAVTFRPSGPRPPDRCAGESTRQLPSKNVKRARDKSPLSTSADGLAQRPGACAKLQG